MKYNCCSIFLSPLLGVPQGLLNQSGGYQVYLGDVSRRGELDWDEVLYLELKKPPSPVLQEYLTEGNGFIDNYQDENGYVYVKELDGEELNWIITPFIKGEYSKIDREYVRKNFPRKYQQTLTGLVKQSVNYMILTKDDSLRKYWEEDKGLNLPESAEVWSAPLRKNEIRNYEITQNVSENLQKSIEEEHTMGYVDSESGPEGHSDAEKAENRGGSE